MTPARRAFVRCRDHLPTRAAACGLLLGAVVWLMAEVQHGNGISQAMALMFVTSAPAAFVCHALAAGRPLPAAQRGRVAQVALAALGLGLLAAVHGLNLLVHGR